MVLRSQGPIQEEDRLTLEEKPIPEPAPGEVRVRVEACGVCHTDLHIVEGDLPLKKPALVPGHQIIGRVESAGEGVGGLNIGARVGIPWFQRGCGACRYCLSGRENLCPGAQFNGYDTDGGFAEFVCVPALSAYAIPEGYEPVEAAPLMCAGVIGYRALKACGVSANDSLALYGFGASAHLVLQVAVARGITVYVFSRSEAHRRLAKALGAEWTGTSADAPPRRFQAAIIFAPVGDLMIEALKNLAPGGRVVSAGIHMSSLPAFGYSLLYYERILTSVANSTRQDVIEFLEEARARRLQVRTEVWPLADANEVLRRLKGGLVNGAAVLTI